MGFSWVFSADVSLPSAAMQAYVAASADPTRFEGWPRDLRVDEPEPFSVGDVLDEIARAPDTEVVRSETSVSVRAIASSDSSLWLDWRAPIAAAIRAAGAFGAEGELVICALDDGGDPGVWLVRVGNGAATVESLRGAAARAARAKARQSVEPLEERIAERFRADGLELPPALASIHARVAAALSRVPDDALLAAAARSQTGFMRNKSFRRLVEHFPDAGSLHQALAHGFARMTKIDALRMAAEALEILTAADPESARELGQEYLAASPPAYLSEPAHAAALPFADGPRAVLAFVREHLQVPALWAGHAAIDGSPIVATLVARADDALRDAAREMLRELLSGELDDRAATLAYVLTLVLPADAEVIDAWVSARSPLLTNYERAWTHRPLALQVFAPYFARDRRDAPQLRTKQQFAAAAMLELDPAEALRRTRGLLEADNGSETSAAALTALLEQLPSRPSLSTPEWHELLANVESKTSLRLGAMVDRVLVAWNVRAAPPPKEKSRAARTKKSKRDV